MDRHVINIGSDRRSARKARVAVRSLLFARDWPPAAVEDAAIVVSELVTNAVQHGQQLLGLTIIVDDWSIRFEAHDLNPAPPLLLSCDSAQPAGYGLRLINAFCHRWGSYLTPATNGEGPGKVVWCECLPPARP